MGKIIIFAIALSMLGLLFIPTISSYKTNVIDETPPTVTFIEPIGLFWLGNELFDGNPFGKLTIVIGKAPVKVSASDLESGITLVTFEINGIPAEFDKDGTDVYTSVLNENIIGRATIVATAYNGNMLTTSVNHSFFMINNRFISNLIDFFRQGESS
jgi:hypothetical protein